MILTRKNLFADKLLESILDDANDGINVVDENGILVYSNKMSADYANTTTEKMLGKPITDFYSEAVLLKVLGSHKAIRGQEIHYVDNKKYVVNSYPLIKDGVFVGAYSIFKDIRDIEELNRKITLLELHLAINTSEEDILDIIGNSGSLINVLLKAKRTVGSLGGPRHSIITGESGTGKTMLANLIYNYAKKVGVIGEDAPFIEINCAQFTNPDIAAVEIFGSEAGAYTGSRQMKGLFEKANGGILFLDEAHALEHYQNILLKAVESGTIRRIGGTKEIKVDVIIIAASTKNLSEQLLPELYQRLAQYALHLPSLSERDATEKTLLFEHFVRKYENAVKEIHNLDYHVSFTKEAKNMLLQAKYPRNIRQFRDVINYSIDAAAPLISDIQSKNQITTIVEAKHIPFESFEPNHFDKPQVTEKKNGLSDPVKELIRELKAQGLGPRKISNALKKKGYMIEYYQVAYFLKKLRQ
jgi:arginine utilization regulatory protein